MDDSVVRDKFVTVKFHLIENTGSIPSQLGGSSAAELALNLFDDANYTAVLERVTPTSAGGYVWSGRIAESETSQVILAVNQGRLAANIAVPPAFYQVRYAGNGVHVIYQIDQSAFPPEAEPIPVELSQEALEDSSHIPMADDGSTIDVLVAYTASAQQAAGGTSAMVSLINLAVAETNTSYANSGVIQRLRLVHAVEVSYTESGDLNTDLPRLRNTSDSYMDNVHALRNQYGADTVSLIVENGGGYCGIAYLMTTVSTAFASSAFNVVQRDCATGYYSFGHELGHNMTARHDWYVDAVNNSPYTYNHGYVNVAGGWRTIMAYNNQCAASGTYCTRLPYWSNPTVTYGGAPMGIPEGQPNATDNRKTLNNTAFTVANFRSAAAMPRAYLPLVNSEIASSAGFDSQFNGSAAAWQSHSGTWSVDANYYSTPGLPNAWSSVSHDGAFTNFDYQAQLWRMGCDTCSTGLAIRGIPEPLSNPYYNWYGYYFLQYTRGGWYSIFKRIDGGNLIEVQAWTFSSAINQGGAWNTLRVVADDAGLSFYINGTLVWSGADTSLSIGQVGIGMFTLGADPDYLYVNWATLSTSGFPLAADTVSPEQQALNEAANKNGGGDPRMAPHGD
jgi:hypothetical protein